MAKSYTKTLVAGFDVLQFIAAQGKADVSVYAVHIEKSDAKTVTKRERGASFKVANMDQAIEDVDAAVAQAVKDGWKLPEVKGGFVPKPDAFSITSLPKPRLVSATPAQSKKK